MLVAETKLLPPCNIRCQTTSRMSTRPQVFCFPDRTACTYKTEMSSRKDEKERGNVRLLFGIRESAFSASSHHHSHPNTQITSVCEFTRKIAQLFSNKISKSASDSHSEKQCKHSTQEQSKIHQLLFIFNRKERLASFQWTHLYTDQCQLLFTCCF